MLLSSDALKLCLLSDAEPVRAAVRASCLPPHEVEIYGLEGFLNPDNTLSPHGTSVVQAAREADAVLIGWSLDRAPLINTVCFAVRSQKTFVPLIALCSGSQEEMIAALAAGVDDATSFPLYLPLLQARVAAHRRVVEAVQRATARRMKQKIEKKKKKTVERVEAEVEQLVEELEERIEEETTGDGLAAHTAREGDAAERLAGVLGVRVERFAEGFVERVAGEIAGDVEAELVLVDPDREVSRVGLLRLDRTAYRVYVGGDEVDLTPKEFELLGFLMEHEGELCTRDQILDTVWDIDFDTGTNMVDVYMHFLRKKLAAHGLGEALETVRGRGYRLTASDGEPA